MKSSEIDEMLHSIREEMEEEREGLTIEQQLARGEKISKEMQRVFHLPIYPKPSWSEK
jgi:hypothetical protein